MLQIKEQLKQLTPYKPGKPIEEVKKNSISTGSSSSLQ